MHEREMRSDGGVLAEADMTKNATERNRRRAIILVDDGDGKSCTHRYRLDLVPQLTYSEVPSTVTEIITAPLQQSC